MIGVTYIGSLLTVVFNNGERRYGQSTILLLQLSITLLLILLLYLLRRFVHNDNLTDWILLGLAMLFYMVNIYLSAGYSFLILIIVFPMYLILFSLMNRMVPLIGFILLTLIQIGYYYINFPMIITQIYTIHYLYFTTSVIASLIIAIHLMILVTRFQKSMASDNTSLLEKNLELTALNEEFFATQEELHDQYDRIQHLAFYDAMTELLNRSGFIHHLEAELKNPTGKGFVVFLDIINFSEVNSAYGLNVGDQILLTIADTLRSFKYNMRHLARVGNDIFAFAINTEDIDGNITKILDDLVHKYEVENEHVVVNFKVGIAVYDSPDLTVSDMMKHADIALTHAKDYNINKYVLFDHAMKESFEEKIQLKTALSTAIQKHRLRVVYQPIVNAKTGRIAHYEALLRWTDPIYGIVSPATFIPLAETTQLMVPLGWHLAEMVLEFTRDNVISGDLAVTISVNASTRQLIRPTFAENVLGYLDLYDIDPKIIGIEITETSLIDDLPLIVRHLKKLRAAGVKVYLDDFGTGYSSLNYLDQLPIDVLKIDKSFVDQLVEDQRKKYLLESVLSLADKLGVETVAEGVETQEQYELLRDMGIDYIQGYYFSKPLEESQVAPHYMAFHQGLDKE